MTEPKPEPRYRIDMVVQTVRGTPNFDHAGDIADALREAALLLADLENVDEVDVMLGTTRVCSVGPKKAHELATKLREGFNLPHLASAIEDDNTIGTELWKLWTELANKVGRDEEPLP